jgi:hypothetical protein
MSKMVSCITMYRSCNNTGQESAYSSQAGVTIPIAITQTATVSLVSQSGGSPG